MITEYEYLKALDVCREYLKQVEKELSLSKKTRIIQWALLRNCSKGLQRVLEMADACSEEPIFIEDITETELWKWRKMGKKRIDEFITLRGY